ncbi:hypothetical protein VE02_07422 [Pseudogymnoascus sp. 03VT05]|nr:hypothetical protein VE02_07422 [Pseudogymnoascus sp. 03VT05]
MGYTQVIISILILLLVTARTFFPGRLPALFLALLHRHRNLLAHPRLPAFIRRHPRLHALPHHDPLLETPIHIPEPRPPALELSPLVSLAPETIQLIASFLPPSAAASFASTCLSIRLMTGTQYLSDLRISPAELHKLLEYITVDQPLDAITLVPPCLICLHCARLVPYPPLCTTPPTPLCHQAYYTHLP